MDANDGELQGRLSGTQGGHLLGRLSVAEVVSQMKQDMRQIEGQSSDAKHALAVRMGSNQSYSKGNATGNNERRGAKNHFVQNSIETTPASSPVPAPS